MTNTKQILMVLLSLCSLNFIAQDTNYTLNGNLGLGTTPETKLDVAGDSKMDGKLTVTDKTSLEGETEIQGDLKISNVSGASDGYVLLVNEDGKVVKMSINTLSEVIRDKETCDEYTGDAKWVFDNNIIHTCPSDSKVGIGTSSPAHTFEVNGNSKIETNLSVGETLSVNTQGHFGQLIPNEFYKLQINSIDGDVNDSGVLINLESSQLKRAITVSNDNTDRFSLFSNGTMVSQLGEDAWNAFEIMNSDGEYIYKIGHTGHVTCTKLMVRNIGEFPDYVFEQNYELMSLLDLEDYINRYKHLPNMPSSSEVKKNGADIGEINRILVEKAEEQTLHLIEHEKKINSLQKEIEQLKKLIIDTQNGTND